MKYTIRISTFQKVLLVFLFMFMGVFTCYHLSHNGEEVVYTKNHITEYENLFKQDIVPGLTLERTYQSRYKSAVAHYSYKNEFDVQIFKVGTFNAQHIDKLVSFVPEVGSQTLSRYDVMYGNVYNTGIHVSYNSDSARVSHVALHLDGDSTTRFLDEPHAVGYYSQVNAFSLNYNNTDKTHIWGSVGEKENHTAHHPMAFAFMLKNGNLYFIYLIPQNLKPFNAGAWFNKLFGK